MAPIASKDAARAGLRFHTVTVLPAARNALAKALPIAPNPIAVMSLIVLLLLALSAYNM